MNLDDFAPPNQSVDSFAPPNSIVSARGENCGDALAKYLNEGPLKDIEHKLPRGGIGYQQSPLQSAQQRCHL